MLVLAYWLHYQFRFQVRAQGAQLCNCTDLPFRGGKRPQGLGSLWGQKKVQARGLLLTCPLIREEASLLEPMQASSDISLFRTELQFLPLGCLQLLPSLSWKTLCHILERNWDFVSRENEGLTSLPTRATVTQTNMEMPGFTLSFITSIPVHLPLH